MKIWVDADACPGAVKEILFRAAQRTGVELTLVANQPLRTPSLPNVRALQVMGGFDVEDNEIVRRAEGGDLVITADIPLAAELVPLGVEVLSPRGERFTESNVRARLNIRDFLDTMRSSGVHTGGPSAYGPRERQAFANALDSWLARRG